MTHIQQVFIKNLRYYRTRAGFSQLAFSEKIDLSPNYLNAVENGKNFPSLEVIQKIIDVLKLAPYQLFLEEPDDRSIKHIDMIQIAIDLKHKIIKDFDDFIKNI